MNRTTKELHGLQILRGLAATAVIIHHTLEESNGAATAFSPNWLTTSGASGVDIFFVISGFVMLYTSFPMVRPPISPGSFIVRRATRIYPLYWICCLAMLGIWLAGFLQHHLPTSSTLALSLALLPSSALILGVSWTLVYEVYFYGIFAITLFSRRAVVSATATTALIAILGVTSGTFPAGTIQNFLANPIPCEFALGLGLAIGFRRLGAIGRRWPISSAWAIPGCVLLALAPLYVTHVTTAGLPGWPRVFAWGLPAALVVAAFLAVGAPRTAFQRGLVFLGDASYSLYLAHIFVMAGYGFILRAEFISQAPQIAIAPVVVLLAMTFGAVVHLAVEKPLLRMVGRWTRGDYLISMRALRRAIRWNAYRPTQPMAIGGSPLPLLLKACPFGLSRGPQPNLGNGAASTRRKK